MPFGFPTVVYDILDYFLLVGLFQQKIRRVHALAWAAVTKFYRLGGLNNKYLFLFWRLGV